MGPHYVPPDPPAKRGIPCPFSLGSETWLAERELSGNGAAPHAGVVVARSGMLTLAPITILNGTVYYSTLPFSLGTYSPENEGSIHTKLVGIVIPHSIHVRFIAVCYALRTLNSTLLMVQCSIAKVSRFTPR